MYIEQDLLVAWELFRQGNERSFKYIYDTFFYPLYNYGLRFTTDAEIAEDAVQDLFTKLWSNRETINQTGSVKNYLYKSYRRIIIAKLQSSTGLKSQRLLEDILDFDFHISYEQIKIEREDLLELQARLQKALNSMNARHKEILYLRFYEDLPFPQIAEMMGLTTKSAYKLVYRALDKLREQLDGIALIFLISLLSLKIK